MRMRVRHLKVSTANSEAWPRKCLVGMFSSCTNQAPRAQHLVLKKCHLWMSSILFCCFPHCDHQVYRCGLSSHVPFFPLHCVSSFPTSTRPTTVPCISILYPLSRFSYSFLLHPRFPTNPQRSSATTTAMAPARAVSYCKKAAYAHARLGTIKQIARIRNTQAMWTGGKSSMTRRGVVRPFSGVIVLRGIRKGLAMMKLWTRKSYYTAPPAYSMPLSLFYWGNCSIH